MITSTEKQIIINEALEAMRNEVQIQLQELEKRLTAEKPKTSRAKAA